jgi:hydrogenase maturation protease
VVSAAPPVSVVGAGNWLFTHDRVGPRVLEKLAGRYGDEVELCDAGSGGLNVLDFLRGQELLLLVDACVDGGRVGEVRVLEPDLDVTPTSGSSVHQIGPIEALIVARELYPEQLPQKSLLILVETEGIDEALMEAACDEVVARLDQELARWRTDARAGSSAGGLPPAGLGDHFVPEGPADGGFDGSQ